MNAGPVSLPNATTEPKPEVTRATSREAFCQGVNAFASAASATLAAVGAVTGGGVGRGAGGRILPFCKTIAPRTTSSSRSIENLPLPGPMESRNFVTLLE